MVERGPEKAGVGGSIPSLATITDTHTVPFLVAAEKFNIPGDFEDRSLRCAFGRKYKTFKVLT